MRWRHTQLLIGTGLIFNIVAALISNLHIDTANQEAYQLIQQQESHKNLIKQTELQIVSLERKRELIFTLITLASHNREPLPELIQTRILSDLNYWRPDKPAPAITLKNLATIEAQINQIQDQLRQEIDAWYLQNIDLMHRYTEKMRNISALRNLALFLQIIGLALILTRDLSRH